MMDKIAFVGTGACDQGAVNTSRLLQFGLIAVYLVLVFLAFKLIILQKTTRKIVKASTVVGLIVLFVICSIIIIITSIGSACSGYNGFL